VFGHSVTLPDVETSLWRALAIYRVLVLGYVVAVVSGRWDDYAHPVRGWVVVAVIAAWTFFAAWAYNAPQRRTWPLLVADLSVAAGTVLASVLVLHRSDIEAGAPTIPTFWVSTALLAWALTYGPAGGAAAAAVLSVADVIERKGASTTTVANMFLLFVAGVVIGYVGRLVLAAEAERVRAAELSAASAERDRLARDIHDGVLQVLAFVQRRGSEIGGEAAELARLAGEQEVALRSLISAGMDVDAQEREADPTRVDLRPLLRRFATGHVSVSTPATPVMLASATARELAKAVATALDNVTAHCGRAARAWVLVEEEDRRLVVTVRDDGPGIAPGRLEAAEGEGRLGVSRSIRGRVRDVGGHVVITSAPGQGTEVELVVPR